MRRKTGRVGRRKVNVPNLSGLSRSQAKTLLESVGLNWSETASTIQNINLDQSIVSQEIESGNTIRIGDTVSFSYYNYVAPPPPPPPPPSGPPSGPPQGPPQGPPPAVSDCTDDDASFCNNIDSQGYGDVYQYQYSPSGQFTCSPRYIGRSFCGVPTPPSGPPSGPPAAPPSGCQEYGIASYGSCNWNPFIAGCTQSVQRYNVDCTTYEDYIFCSGCSQPPADPPAAPPSGPPSGPPADPPFGPPIGKSVSVSTMVRTTSGLVRAENLNVGDVLLSADLEGFPYNPAEGVTEEALAWTSDNPNLNIVNTTIVGITRRISEKAVVVNGDIFSQWHWILVKRNDITQFVRSEEIIEGTDYIFDIDSNSWEIVDLFEIIEVGHETVSIDCEPYDMFFTEKMLTHDSFSI
jgi:hypothetical protein